LAPGSRLNNLLGNHIVIVINSSLIFEVRDLLAHVGCAPTLLIA
jgi:hypothetical protein